MLYRVTCTAPGGYNSRPTGELRAGDSIIVDLDERQAAHLRDNALAVEPAPAGAEAQKPIVGLTSYCPDAVRP